MVSGKFNTLKMVGVVISGKHTHCTFWPTMFLVLFTPIALVEGNTITVGFGGSGSYDYATIQEGINAAANGDTILVMPNTYTIHMPISFKGKAIMVRSQDGPKTTIIQISPPLQDATRGGVVVFETGEGPESILEGFTMTGGTGTQGYYYATSYLGGGVFCFRSSPTIKDNVIINNIMPLGTTGIYGYGGGVACVESNAKVVGS